MIVLSKLKTNRNLSTFYGADTECCEEGHKSAVICVLKDKEKSILRVKQ